MTEKDFVWVVEDRVDGVWKPLASTVNSRDTARLIQADFKKDRFYAKKTRIVRYIRDYNNLMRF